MRYILAFLAFSLFLTITAQEETFIKEDWNKALAVAKETGKPIVVDFYTDWCYWCKVMDKETFSDEAIQEKLKTQYVAVKLDAENGIGADVARKYRVSAFPTIGFFTYEGKLIGKTPGYIELDAFGPLLDSMAKKNIANANYYPGITDNLNVDFPQMYLDATAQNGKRKFPKEDELEKWFNDNDDIWESEVYFSMISKFYWLASQNQTSLYLERKKRYASLFGEDDAEGISNNFVGVKYRKIAKEKDKAGFEQLMAELPDFYSDADAAEKSIAFYKMNFASAIGDFKELTKLVTDAIDKDDIHIGSLNSFAWDMYKNCNDPECLKVSLDWMKTVIEEEPSYAYVDTYAALAFKLKDYDLAKQYALMAIEIGKENGDEVKGTEELLAKIEADSK